MKLFLCSHFSSVGNMFIMLMKVTISISRLNQYRTSIEQSYKFQFVESRKSEFVKLEN